MSAIGDYIHLTWEGYRKDTELQKAFVDGKTRATRIITKKPLSLTIQQVELLEEGLNYIKKNVDNQDYDNFRDMISSNMKEKFGNQLQKIDYTNFNMTLNKASSDMIGKIKLTETTWGKIREKTDKLKDIMIRLGDSAQKLAETGIESSKLELDLKELENVLTELKNYDQQFSKEPDFKKFKENKTTKNYKKIQGLIEIVNNFIEIYAKWPAVLLQKGTLFEEALALVPLVADYTGDEETVKFFKKLKSKGVKGLDVELVEYKKENFSKTIDHKIFDGILSTKSSQGKIDVSLSFGPHPIDISAKNINLSQAHYIHLAKETSLLFLLQDEKPTVVDNFLNLQARHYKQDNKGKWKIQNATSEYNKKRKAIIQELKIIFLSKALSGNIGGREAVNLFIVNDNSQQGQIKVFTLKQILEKVFESNNLIGTKNFSEDMPRFKNAPESMQAERNKMMASQRITNLISDVHSRKISISIRADAI